MDATGVAHRLHARPLESALLAVVKKYHRIVRRWFVMSMLTGRHSGSFESTWEQDIGRIGTLGAAAYLKQIEESVLTDGFWEVALPAALETTSTASPFFQTFLAAQVATGVRGFLSKSITVAAMHQQSGDIHHIVPKDYLRKNGFPDRADYNQVANFALTETPINISIGNEPPVQYMAEVAAQIESGQLTLGEITSTSDLERNLEENAVPANLATVTAGSYPEFLDVKVGRRAAASPPGRDAPALADPAQLADVKSATAKL